MAICRNVAAVAALAGALVASAADAAPIRWSTSLYGANGYVDPVTPGAPNVPRSNLFVSLTFYGDTDNSYFDGANGIRLFASTAEPEITVIFNGMVNHPLPEYEADRVFAVGSGQYDSYVAYGNNDGGLVSLGEGIHGPGLSGYTGFTSIGPTAVDIEGTPSLIFLNGNELVLTSWASATFEAVLLGAGTVDDPLMPTIPVTPGGGFVFDFTATGGVPVYVDPVVAVGYDYKVEDGSPLITKALFPIIGSSVYDIYDINDPSVRLFQGIAGGVEIDFTTLFPGGVAGFTLKGVDPSALLDPQSSTAFMTQLTFATDGDVRLTQTALTAFVPEPSAWAMLILGFGCAGVALRRRRRAFAAA